MGVKTDCGAGWKSLEIARLTRRAKHWQNGIIERVDARGVPRAFLCFCGDLDSPPGVIVGMMFNEAQS